MAFVPSQHWIKTMQSIINILFINTRSGVSKKTQLPYSMQEAHCVVIDEHGESKSVGVLMIPKALESVAKPGMFSAMFSLAVSEYGQDQGRIVARITGLTPLAPGALQRLPPAASASVSPVAAK